MKKIYTCIDIGTDTIRILVSEYYGKKFRTLAVSSVRSKGIKRGVIVDESLVLERLKLALDDIILSWTDDYIDALATHALKLKAGARSIKKAIETDDFLDSFSEHCGSGYDLCMVYGDRYAIHEYNSYGRYRQQGRYESPDFE